MKIFSIMVITLLGTSGCMSLLAQKSASGTQCWGVKQGRCAEAEQKLGNVIRNKRWQCNHVTGIIMLRPRTGRSMKIRCDNLYNYTFWNNGSGWRVNPSN